VWVSSAAARGRIKPSGSGMTFPPFSSCAGGESHCHLQNKQNKKN